MGSYCPGCTRFIATDNILCNFCQDKWNTQFPNEPYPDSGTWDENFAKARGAPLAGQRMTDPREATLDYHMLSDPGDAIIDMDKVSTPQNPLKGGSSNESLVQSVEWEGGYSKLGGDIHIDRTGMREATERYSNRSQPLFPAEHYLLVSQKLGKEVSRLQELLKREEERANTIQAGLCRLEKEVMSGS